MDDVYQFNDSNLQTRFVEITKQLRCMTCQNQTLYDSAAPLAGEFKQEIQSMLQDGKSNQDITNFFVVKYGEAVSYTPNFTTSTYALWLSPVLLLLLGWLILVAHTRKDK